MEADQFHSKWITAVANRLNIIEIESQMKLVMNWAIIVQIVMR